MNANVGGLDRTLRIVGGVALLGLLAFGPAPLRWWGALGFVMLGTALLNFCPLYSVLGINTCPVKRT